MSILIFPDEMHTEWIAWKKISKKSAGIETSRFRSTSERFSQFNSTLPSLNISPLNVSIRPLHNNRNSCPRPLNSNLLIQLPPFSGSLKSRHTAMILPDGRNLQKVNIYATKDIKNDLLQKSNFFYTKDNTSKTYSKRKIKRFLKVKNHFKQKLEGIIGIKLLNEINGDSKDSPLQKTRLHNPKNKFN